MMFDFILKDFSFSAIERRFFSFVWQKFFLLADIRYKCCDWMEMLTNIQFSRMFSNGNGVIFVAF